MEKNFSDLDFVLLIGVLFIILTIVNTAARLQRRLATRKLAADTLPASKSEKTPAPSFIKPGINWIKVKDAEPEEEIV